VITGSNSKVWSSETTEALITGPFQDGVDCHGNAGSRVVGIRFENIEHNAIHDCAKAESNVIISSGAYAIYYFGVANTDRITNNYIRTSSGIYVEGNAYDTEIAGNVIVMTTPVSGAAKGIVFDNNVGDVDVTDNVFFGDATPIDLPTALGGETFARNFCNADFTACTDCIDDGYCADAATPFQGAKTVAQ
jgi:hypothetical protein